ncbi:MAG TPA: hypothetical protein VG649_05390 [Candidatus Angelobacter sp.]|jgi:hypothetical protein|nr:hypothetical protein [Candidatus Angelobacter sp.]
MKKNLARFVLALQFFMAGASTPLLADGTMPLPPFCPPDCTCH